MQVLLIKRDIRLEQNYALVRACEGVKAHGKIIPLFVFEPSLWARPEYSLRHQNFVKECLESYAKRVAGCGGELVVAVGEVLEVLTDLAERFDITRIVAHEEVTDSVGYRRDIALRAWARSKGIAILEVEQNNVKRGHGEHMPFATWFETAAQAKVRNPVGRDLSDYLATGVKSRYAGLALPRVAGAECVNRQRGGREEAERILSRFFNPTKLLSYPYQMSSPSQSIDGCSRLSPHLAWGVVSHAEVAKKVNDVVSMATDMPPDKFERLQNAARFYLDRIRWRMGYHAHCEVNPYTDEAEYFSGFKKQTDNDAASRALHDLRLQAMRTGQTGIPYIDACLRQLMATGYLSFRARSTTANFLCMGLGLHWRDVGEHLASVFLDFDGGAIHWSQMRIASGTGLADTFLVYSVAKQARDFDPECTWQKKWLPELRNLPQGLIHEIWKKPDSLLAEHGLIIGEDYPRAICDPELASQEGKRRVHQIRHGP